MICSRFPRKAFWLLLAVLATAIAVVLIGSRWAQAARQRAAVARLREAGVILFYDYDLERERWKGSCKQFLRRVIGDDMAGNVRMVIFGGDRIPTPEPNLEPLSALPSVDQVSFSGFDVSEELISCLYARAPQVSSIGLYRSTNNDGLAGSFSVFPNLESLRLDGVAFSGECRPHFGDIRRLKHLAITFAKIPQGTLKELVHCVSLTALDIRGSDAGDAAIQSLRSLRSLEVLDLDYTSITDAAAEYLNGFPHLRRLSVNGTALTDQGAASLERLRGLEMLSLARTNVTDAGIQRLREALPRCRIVVGTKAAGED